MLDSLSAMIDRGTLIIRDADTLDELRNFIKITKTRTDGSKYVRMCAKAGHKDDRVASLWIYAGTRSLKEIEGRKCSSNTHKTLLALFSDEVSREAHEISLSFEFSVDTEVDLVASLSFQKLQQVTCYG